LADRAAEFWRGCDCDHGVAARPWRANGGGSIAASPTVSFALPFCRPPIYVPYLF